MEKLPEFQAAARVDGFVEVKDGDDENVAWFRNELPDSGTNVHKRLCIDSLSGSATVYWEADGSKLHSKTFSTVSNMQALASIERRALTPRTTPITENPLLSKAFPTKPSRRPG